MIPPIEMPVFVGAVQLSGLELIIMRRGSMGSFYQKRIKSSNG